GLDLEDLDAGALLVLLAVLGNPCPRLDGADLQRVAELDVRDASPRTRQRSLARLQSTVGLTRCGTDTEQRGYVHTRDGGALPPTVGAGTRHPLMPDAA